MDSPDEIKKWVESRKRNYPTKRRIENKVAQDKDREENGELASQ